MTEPREVGLNGKKCYHCIGNDCTATAHCMGKEDHCISKSGSNTFTVSNSLMVPICRLPLMRLCLSVDRGNGLEISKGCATLQFCHISNNPHLRSAMGGEIKCCQGDFCNSASSTKVGLMLLVAPLVPLALFS